VTGWRASRTVDIARTGKLFVSAAIGRVDITKLSRLVDDQLLSVTATLRDPVEGRRTLLAQLWQILQFT
jgi:hypothetical protein